MIVFIVISIIVIIIIIVNIQRICIITRFEVAEIFVFLPWLKVAALILESCAIWQELEWCTTLWDIAPLVCGMVHWNTGAQCTGVNTGAQHSGTLYHQFIEWCMQYTLRIKLAMHSVHCTMCTGVNCTTRSPKWCTELRVQLYFVGSRHREVPTITWCTTSPLRQFILLMPTALHSTWLNYRQCPDVMQVGGELWCMYCCTLQHTPHAYMFWCPAGKGLIQSMVWCSMV